MLVMEFLQKYLDVLEFQTSFTSLLNLLELQLR